MSITKILIAATLSLGFVAVATPASAEPHPHGWHRHKVCSVEWHHHHKVRVCHW